MAETAAAHQIIYADNAATTALSQTALEAMLPYFSQVFGNPSSPHRLGQEAAAALWSARERIAACLGCMAREIYFTSGGSEADCQAIISAAKSGAAQGKMHLISTTIEHHAVLHALDRLREEGFSVTLLPVSENGIVDPSALEAALRPDTALVSVMYANNEIGTIQPISEIGRICRAHGVLFHTDAVQAAGHLPVCLNEAKKLPAMTAGSFSRQMAADNAFASGQMATDTAFAYGQMADGSASTSERIAASPAFGSDQMAAFSPVSGVCFADYLTLSAHKFHGPKGIGVLFARRGVPLRSLIEGGAQERGKRAGTENVPAIVGMAAALEECISQMNETAERLIPLRDCLIQKLLQIPGSVLNGDAVRRLPGNVNISFEGVEAEALLLLLDQRGICASSGSACTSGSLEPSHVLLALGRSPALAHGSLRLSLGEDVTEAKIGYLAEQVRDCVLQLRSSSAKAH